MVKELIATLGIGLGLLFFGFGIAILAGGFAGDFVTRDGAQTVGAILFVGGPICGLVGMLALRR